LKKKDWKKIWRFLTEGWMGWITYSILGFVIAFLTYRVLGIILSTDMPAVAVVTSSMSHNIENGIICGKRKLDYKQSFDNWWEECKDFYLSKGITKEEFRSFPIKDGFLIGDMPIVQGAKEYKVGDIIVFSVKGARAPIIHRVIKINRDGTYQTKGDHNSGQLNYELSVKKDQIHGKVIFIIPKLGYFKVIISKIFGVV
jgi:signal peptidase I